MRDGNWRNKQNWKLVCSHCGAEFEDTEEIDLTGDEGHFAQEHPGEPISFTSRWVGKGRRPKRTPWS